MKRIVITIAIIIGMFLLFAFLMYGDISPVDDVSGCYVSRLEKISDKICIKKSGIYEQFAITEGVEKKYNEGSCRTFQYSTNDDVFTAVVLYEYSLVDNQGAVTSKLELDIQPHKNSFGKVLFSVGENLARPVRYYSRE